MRREVAIRAAMSDGGWHTIPEIQEAIGGIYNRPNLHSALSSMHRFGTVEKGPRLPYGHHCVQWRLVQEGSE